MYYVRLQQLSSEINLTFVKFVAVHRGERGKDYGHHMS